MPIPTEEEEAEEPQHPVLLLEGLDAHHTEVERLEVLVVPRLALVVDTHTDPAGLHMHEEEEEDTVDGVAVAVAGILPLEDSLHRHHHHRGALHPNMKVEGMGGNHQAVAVARTQHLPVDHVQTIADS